MKRVRVIDKSGGGGGVTRRRFMVGSGGALGLTAAASLGLPDVGLGKEKAEFIESSCGNVDKAKARVLVAYASRCGSTGGVADAIGKQLCELGAAADVRLIKNAPDLTPYNAVIVGGAGRNEKWLKAAREFVYDHRQALSQLPVAYFVTCLKTAPGQPSLSLKGPLPENETVERKRLRVKAYLAPLIESTPRVKPLDIAVFAGALDYGKLNRAETAMLKSSGFIEGDFRDWKRIRDWTSRIAPALFNK